MSLSWRDSELFDHNRIRQRETNLRAFLLNSMTILTDADILSGIQTLYKIHAFASILVKIKMHFKLSFVLALLAPAATILAAPPGHYGYEHHDPHHHHSSSRISSSSISSSSSSTSNSTIISSPTSCPPCPPLPTSDPTPVTVSETTMASRADEYMCACPL
ncbi:hypothetical protein SCHPADRAFT_182273 [Schizopora paradoxa]|uniref:Uncharacterized protein n=1 Tax=Schizopora paradoxa TaxID=27342 RepID=A0A0H2RZT6_9AGAM|nr:hypothetical protein SCHPADRAFT_182273 [Schizopora paradoxa]